jgi:hypothetical protein
MTKRDATRQKFDYYEGQMEGIDVYSWCPTPKPTVPPTQVHLHIPIAGAKVVLRFKGTGTLDALIAALVDHRRDVWGEPGPR